MTTATVTCPDGTRLHTRADGPEDAQPLLLCNSLGTDLTMWDPQVSSWAETRRVIRFDQRGHGRSSVPTAPYSIQQLGEDAVTVLDAYELDQPDVCGLSLGGMVALWLAGNVGHRLGRIVLADTAAKVGTAEGWQARIGAVRQHGMDAVAQLALARFFTPSFLTSGAPEVAAVRQMVAETDPQGYIGSCQALASADLRQLASQVAAPTLVVVGEADEATPVADAQDLHARISGSDLHVIPDAGHLSNLEQPEAFSSKINRFANR